MMSMRKRIRGLTPEEIKNIPKGKATLNERSSNHLSDELEAPCTQEDFDQAISKIQPSVSQADIKKYQDWLSEFGIPQPVGFC